MGKNINNDRLQYSVLEANTRDWPTTKPPGAVLCTFMQWCLPISLQQWEKTVTKCNWRILSGLKSWK